MIESLREENEPSMIERADEREREHHFRVHEAHPKGIPVEDPRGRSLECDFVINANTDEFPTRALPPFVNMLNYNAP